MRIITKHCWFKEACEQVYELKRDPDQSQDIIPSIVVSRITIRQFELKKCLVKPMSELIGKIDAFPPFFKHEFWKEEEVRASLCFPKEAVSDKIKYRIQT